nr:hypothetical protein [Tanacetum cinerariifolium]
DTAGAGRGWWPGHPARACSGPSAPRRWARWAAGPAGRGRGWLRPPLAAAARPLVPTAGRRARWRGHQPEKHES